MVEKLSEIIINPLIDENSKSTIRDFALILKNALKEFLIKKYDYISQLLLISCNSIEINSEILLVAIEHNNFQFISTFIQKYKEKAKIFIESKRIYQKIINILN